ncbi:LON peptidase substrate-binding domain-containing protein [Magnetovibrio sp.]|uniref:LON peptidase substrate-binding domain-containing protein n=1 Tax=Magnetovibrio sp. TaxID=2024836 RepID=UPI002F953A9E
MLGERPPLALPTRLPVFPLTGAVLLPFGHLPLNIFEPRYIHMVDDALGASRLIAMIQPRIPESGLVANDAELYDVGTVGRIIQFSDPGDGRYLITLEGLMRFRTVPASVVTSERGYRTLEADYSPFLGDLDSGKHDDKPSRDRIVELMKIYFAEQSIDADWDAVKNAPYEALVASLAMSCPFAPEEKQALLQCDSHKDRAHMLIALFEMSGDDGHNSGKLKH